MIGGVKMFNDNVGIGIISFVVNLDVVGMFFLCDRVVSDYIILYSGNELLMFNGVNNYLYICGNIKIIGIVDFNDGSNRIIIGI